MAEEVDAAKSLYGRKEALALAARASRLVVARGARVVEVDLRAPRSHKEILGLMLGPTGRLRAPTMRVGSTLFVGFPREGFETLG